MFRNGFAAFHPRRKYLQRPRTMANASTPDAHSHESRAAKGQRRAVRREIEARILRQRARSLLSLAILALPAFALAHAWLLPPARLALGATHAALLLACALAREGIPRVRRLGALRNALRWAYALLFAGAAAVSVQIASFGEAAPGASHFLAAGFFVLIALSIPILRLPKRDLRVILLGAAPSMAVAISCAPSAVLWLYTLGTALSALVVWRGARLDVARRERPIALEFGGEEEAA